MPKSPAALLGSLISSYVLLAGISAPECAVRAADLAARPSAVLNGEPAILSATLALMDAQLPLCEDINDGLPVVFSFPVAGDLMNATIDPAVFEVVVVDETAGSVDQPVVVTPKCATLAPAAEPGERRTVLLLGDFTPGTMGPVQVCPRLFCFPEVLLRR